MKHTQLGLFEKELNKVPWYLTFKVNIMFYCKDIKYLMCKILNNTI